jgi:acyl-coenzyme A thioesterase PaaI-like protein
MDAASGLQTALADAKPVGTVDRIPTTLRFPVDIDAAGVATLDLHDGLRNTAQALVGGATAVLLDATAVAAAGHGVATDLEIHYLGPARTGPVVARPALVGRSKPSLVAVTVVDAGADDRLVAEAYVRVTTA